MTGIYQRELRPLELTASQMVILALTAKQGRILVFFQPAEWRQAIANHLDD